MTMVSHWGAQSREIPCSDLGFRTLFWQPKGGTENGGRKPGCDSDAVGKEQCPSVGERRGLS